MSKVKIYTFDDANLPPECQAIKDFFIKPQFGQPAKLTGLQKARLAAEKIRRNIENRKHEKEQLGLSVKEESQKTIDNRKWA